MGLENWPADPRQDSGCTGSDCGLRPRPCLPACLRWRVKQGKKVKITSLPGTSPRDTSHVRPVTWSVFVRPTVPSSLVGMVLNSKPPTQLVWETQCRIHPSPAWACAVPALSTAARICTEGLASGLPGMDCVWVCPREAARNPHHYHHCLNLRRFCFSTEFLKHPLISVNNYRHTFVPSIPVFT